MKNSSRFILTLTLILVFFLSACKTVQYQEPTPQPETQNNTPSENQTSPQENESGMSSNPESLGSSPSNFDLLKTVQGSWVQLQTGLGEDDLDHYYRQKFCWMEEWEKEVNISESKNDGGERIWTYTVEDRKRHEYEITKVQKDPLTEGVIFTIKDNQTDEEESNSTHQVRMVVLEGDVWYIEDGIDQTFLVTHESNKEEYEVKECE